MLRGQVLLLQVVLYLALVGCEFVDSECNRDDDAHDDVAYLQHQVARGPPWWLIHLLKKRKEKEMKERYLTSGQCDEDKLNTGRCDLTDDCQKCKGNEGIPRTADRFASGKLECSGTASCKSNDLVFKYPGDYLECSGLGACESSSFQNVGAACISGIFCGANSFLQLNNRDFRCDSDLCCSGEDGACQTMNATGLGSVSCSGVNSCSGSLMELEGHLACSGRNACGAATTNSISSGTKVHVLSRPEYTFTGGGTHCINCTGDSHTCTADFGLEDGGRTAMFCGQDDCSESVISLAGGACLHLTCAAGGCRGLDITKGPGLNECHCAGDPVACGQVKGCELATMSDPCGITCPVHYTCCEAENAEDDADCSKCCRSKPTRPTSSAMNISEGPGSPEISRSPAISSPEISEIGAVAGDPHLITLDGEHYTMLDQGSFLFWSFSGVKTEIPLKAKTAIAAGLMKSVTVNWEIYMHYSGHLGFTKGVLLVDRTAKPHQVLEMTSQDCIWRSNYGTSWLPVEPELLTLSDAQGHVVTAFNVTEVARKQKNIELLMNSKEGLKKIAQLWVRCRPGNHLDAKLKMSSESDVHYVKGELQTGRRNAGLLTSRPAMGLAVNLVALDQAFQAGSKWQDLGGSSDAAAYLAEVDNEGPFRMLKSCAAAEKAAAAEMCRKHLGAATSASQLHSDFFADCVADLCAGGGEAAAELAAEILWAN